MPPTPKPSLAFDRSLFTPGQRVAVAVSGGADSTALLLALRQANTLPREALGVGLSAIHIHHGLRGEAADRDHGAVERLCAECGVPLEVRRVDTAAQAASSGQTTEEAARHLRYHAFAELLSSGAADVVATAHTADDQAETVLLKLLRGAWTEGLAGIFPVVEVKGSTGRTGMIVRPLLRTDRSAVEEYLRGLGQSWVEDETNADPAFTRNRLRHTLMPQLRAFNPALNQALGNLADLARDDEAFWQAELGRVLPQAVLPGRPVRGGGRANSTAPDAAVLAIDLERLKGAPPALRSRMVRATARQLGVQLSFDETARLLALAGLRPPMATVPSRIGGVLSLANGIRAERSARELRLSRSAGPAESRQTP